MSPKLTRLLFVAMLAAGFSAPMLVASAAPQPRSVDAFNMPKGFFVLGAEPSNRLEVNPYDTVSWNIMEGEHTITPKDAKQWGDGGSETLNGDSTRYTAKNFKNAGQDYVYYCKLHGGLNEGNEPEGMWGVIHVKAPPATQPPATQPPATEPPTTQPPATQTTVTTRPGATPPATTATAPTTRPGPTAPAPTTTTVKPDKKKDAKEEETTTTSSTLPPPIDLPNEAIVPTLPGPGAAPGSEAELPADTPEGEALALLKSKKNNGGDAMKLLIVSGLGLGALGVGTAGYKYANRSSKYFPA